MHTLGFPGGSAGNESTCNVRGLGSIPGLGRYPGERNGYPLQYFGLKNYMDSIVHGGHKKSNMTEWLSLWTSLVAQSVKSAYSVRDLGLIPGSGRCPGEGNSYLLQYSCVENFMHRGAWWATIHGVTKSRAQLSDFTFNAYILIKY